MNATALIAEDEPILAQALSTMLLRLWPELHILPLAQDGGQAVEMALSHLPDVLFLDIQMPDRDGLDASQAIVEAWPTTRPLPLLVFVTAYDEHAVSAFERAAVDYVLKPVQTPRLAVTCERLVQLLKQRSPQQDEQTLDGLRTLYGTVAAQRDEEALPASGDVGDASEAGGINPPPASAPVTPLKVLQAAVANGLQIVQIEDVLYFEAADKYVRIVTNGRDVLAAADLLIRTPLRELVPRLDADQFWQIHRGIVVNIKAIERVSRVYGRLRVHVRGRPETLEVSRMYAHLFKAM